jgi:plasmid stability protein
MSSQYTIRSIPESLDQALRDRAAKESKSLNTIVIESLMQSLSLDAKPMRYNDLDALINSWQEDPGFDQAQVEFETIDEEMWK